MGGGFGIGDLEAAFLEVVTVVDEGAGDEEGAFGVHDDVDVGGADEEVPIGGAIDEVHFILEAGAAAADDGETERAIGATLAREEGVEFLGGLLRDLAKLLVADLVIDGGFGGFGHFHGSNMVPGGRRRKCRAEGKCFAQRRNGPQRLLLESLFAPEERTHDRKI